MMMMMTMLVIIIIIAAFLFILFYFLKSKNKIRYGVIMALYTILYMNIHNMKIYIHIFCIDLPIQFLFFPHFFVKKRPHAHSFFFFFLRFNVYSVQSQQQRKQNTYTKIMKEMI